MKISFTKAAALVVVAFLAASLLMLSCHGCAQEPPGETISIQTAWEKAAAVDSSQALLTLLGILNDRYGFVLPPFGTSRETIDWRPPECGAFAAGYRVYFEATFLTSVPTWSAYIDTLSTVGYKVRVAAFDTNGVSGPYTLPYTYLLGPVDPGPEVDHPCPPQGVE